MVQHLNSLPGTGDGLRLSGQSLLESDHHRRCAANAKMTQTPPLHAKKVALTPFIYAC